jgi:L-seryl-tRNA(Ser) seleniumtransferase
MKSEVIIQKAHRFGYERALRNTGIRFVEVETVEDLERAVTWHTAMMLFYNNNNKEGQIPDVEWARLGKKYGVPTFNDAAADVPPVENFWKYTQMGFDLVTFSGGKGLRGPQSAGLLLGRKDLIQAARMNSSPNGDAIGRGMKVNKEELLGALVAVESFLKQDHDAARRDYDERAELIRKSATAVPGVQAEVFVPEVANHVPHIRITWDAVKVGITPEKAIDLLRDGTPSIRVRPGKEVVVGVWMMRASEAPVVAKRLREVLEKKA